MYIYKYLVTHLWHVVVQNRSVLLPTSLSVNRELCEASDTESSFRSHMTAVHARLKKPLNLKISLLVTKFIECLK